MNANRASDHDRIHSSHRASASRLVVRVPVVFLGMIGAVQAEPVVIEETARIESPQSDRDIRYITRWDSAQYSSRISVSGNRLILLGLHYDESVDPYIQYTPWIFARTSTGEWTHGATLPDLEDWPELHFGVPVDVSIDGNTAAARGIFGWTGSSWVKSSADTVRLGPEVVISGGTIADSSDAFLGYSADIYARGSSGTWSRSQTVTVPDVYKFSDGEYHGADIDLSGNQLIIHVPYGDVPPDYTDSVANQAHIFERSSNTWSRVGFVSAYGEDVAIENGTAVVGETIFKRSATGVWNFSESFERPERVPSSLPRPIALRDGLLVTGHHIDNVRGTGSGSISVWQRDANGRLEEVARLVASDARAGSRLGYDLDVDGRRIVAVANGAAYVFDVPQTLARREPIADDFEDGNASNWQALPGSTFSIASVSGSRVYRQSNVSGDAGSILGSADWNNIAIQADIRPTQFSVEGTNRWFGLVVRRSDANNYYYITARHTNVLQLKKRVNGVYSTIASVPLPVSLNRTYRLRLEAIGTRLRVFNGAQLLIETTDASHQHGQAGIAMYRTAANIDNVLVNSGHQTTLYATNFARVGDASQFKTTGEGNWVGPSEQSQVFTQTATETPNGARALAPVSSPDHSVQARVRPTTFSATGSPWFGLIGRYRNDSNFYYVTMRKTNVASLRKLVNGAIVELDSVPITVTAGQWYTLRLECIGDAVRVYVNDTLRLEARDSTHTKGNPGLMTYRTAAQYDDFAAWKH